MDELGWLLIALLLFFVGGFMGTIFPMWEQSEIKELGSAICEEEYNMDYEEYYNGILKCKPFELKESYDGISVEVAKAQTQAVKRTVS